MIKVALLGAAGKMGRRIYANLRASRDCDIKCVERSENGRQFLETRGVRAVSEEEALPDAQVVILAVPDAAVGPVARSISPRLRTDALVVILDAAAPFAGEVKLRDDLACVVTHPCHPSLFETTTSGSEQERDFFGGVSERQHIVCALHQGSAAAREEGERIARLIYAPVDRCHWITVEQLALLEPVLTETVAATCLSAIREALSETIRRGVPPEAAKDFLLGHLSIELAIIFDQMPEGRFSDGALRAMKEAQTKLFQSDWLRVFDPEEVEASVRSIIQTRE